MRSHLSPSFSLLKLMCFSLFSIERLTLQLVPTPHHRHRSDRRCLSSMSRSGRIQKPSADPADRFNAVVSFNADKPDSKPFTDLGSPISPLRPPLPAISSSSSGSMPPPPKDPTPPTAPARRRHSGELSASSDGSPTSLPHPRHRRSCSGPFIFSGGRHSQSTNNNNSASSPAANVLPAGNICPSGKLRKPALIPRTSPRADVLGSGTGHGSIMRGSKPVGERRGVSAAEAAEEMTRAGNEQYKRGQLVEALRFYEKAVAMCPGHAACRNNRAAALMGLGRLAAAVRECEEAVKLDPTYGRAQQRLTSLMLRLGQVDNARRHFNLAGQHRDHAELQKLQAAERHLQRCEEFRKIRDWRSALREVDAAIASGIDSSTLLMSLRAETLLRLHHLEEADSTLSNARKLEITSSFSTQSQFFGMISGSYIYLIQAQVEMALGRLENAVVAAEKAWQIDPRNGEVNVTLNNVRAVAKARVRGNELFNLGNYVDACIAYGEGLKYDPSNPILHCNRAACHSKLEQWQRSVDDCNVALRIHPKYTKALLRRAACNAKLERWVESVRDYEVLRKELPEDKEVAENLFHAQVALKTSRGEEVSNMKFGGEVEQITGREQFKGAISLPGVSVVYFLDPLDPQSAKTTQFVDSLCSRHPSLNFLKVNIKESADIAKGENVLTFPTFKIYKNGLKVKEMIRPNHQMLEYSVKHYSIQVQM